MKKFSMITGAAGLLGVYHAQALINLGHNVLMTDLDLKLLKKKSKEIKKLKSGQQLILKKLDVTSEKSISNLVKILKKKNNIINILINNAAIDSKVTKIINIVIRSKILVLKIGIKKLMWDSLVQCYVVKLLEKK